MRLSCPACHTEYEVPDAALAGRTRTLRCGHCDHQWQVGALDPAPLAPQLVASAALPEQRRLEAYPQPAMTAERAPTPVSFVPEPPAPAVAAPKRKYPIPDPPGAEPADRYKANAAAKLTYDTESYSYPGDIPAARAEKSGASAWLVSILLLLIAVVMVWVERVHIMQIWTPSARLFDAITGLLQHK